MEDKRGRLVLGLVPDIDCCGFCLIDTTSHEVLEMGTHTFAAPQDPKTKESLAAGRRAARSVRRNVGRTRGRLSSCLAVLVAAGLVPEGEGKGWLQTRRGDRQVLELRAAGLDERLTDRELAQVLYSLCRHRGYIPHGEGSGDDEGKRVLGAIRRNSEAMEAGGFRTVGEMLAASGTSRNHAGDYSRCVLSSQLVDEARAILAAQRRLGNERATEALERDYVECMTRLRDTYERDLATYALVGPCTYFPDLRRAASADLSSELCRAYERLCHTTVAWPDGSEEPLDRAVADACVSTLFSPTPIKGNKACRVRYSDLRRSLSLPAAAAFKGVPADREAKEEPFAPMAWRCMREALPVALLERFLSDRALADDVCEALAFTSGEGSLRRRLEGVALSDEELEAVLALPFSSRAFKGYGRRSRKALGILLDAFEDDGVRSLHDAEAASGLLGARSCPGRQRSALLPPYSAYDPTCSNPVVLRSVGRMRHIVNSIVRAHGIPDEVHIQLGRSLRQSAREKASIARDQRAREDARRKCAERAAAILHAQPSEVPERLVAKLVMLDQQGGVDPYTGERIPVEALVTDETLCDLGHILPYSRTCDDGRANRVLALSAHVRAKGDRTPYEWMHSGEPGAPDWDEFVARVTSAPMDPRRRSRYLDDSLDPYSDAERISRNTNDRRYMVRALRSYVADCLAVPGGPDRVTAVAAGATAALRRAWGLARPRGAAPSASDRAVDAAIVAACTPATMAKAARARALGPNTFRQVAPGRLSGSQPWPGFADDVSARRSLVIPTRMVDHGLSGRAFQDTLYRLDGYTDDKARYPIVSADRRTDAGRVRRSAKRGNVRMQADGSVRIVDGLAFLRLWLDPDARPTGKVRGRWYAEPVYYADVPAIKAGTYVPRACAIGVPRVWWGQVPDSALASSPVTLFPGDALVVNGRLGRFAGLTITGCRLDVRDIRPRTTRPTDSPSPSARGEGTRRSGSSRRTASATATRASSAQRASRSPRGAPRSLGNGGPPGRRAPISFGSRISHVCWPTGQISGP